MPHTDKPMTLDLNNLWEAVPVAIPPEKEGYYITISTFIGDEMMLPDDRSDTYFKNGKWLSIFGWEVVSWLRPIPRERIEEALRDKFKTMYQSGNRKGLAGYGLHNKSTEYDMEMHITELINQTIGNQ